MTGNLTALVLFGQNLPKAKIGIHDHVEQTVALYAELLEQRDAFLFDVVLSYEQESEEEVKENFFLDFREDTVLHSLYQLSYLLIDFSIHVDTDLSLIDVSQLAGQVSMEGVKHQLKDILPQFLVFVHQVRNQEGHVLTDNLWVFAGEDLEGLEVLLFHDAFQ